MKEVTDVRRNVSSGSAYLREWKAAPGASHKAFSKIGSCGAIKRKIFHAVLAPCKKKGRSARKGFSGVSRHLFSLPISHPGERRNQAKANSNSGRSEERRVGK